MSKAKGGRFMDDFGSSDESEAEVKPTAARTKNRFMAISSSDEDSSSDDNSSSDSSSDGSSSGSDSDSEGSSSNSDSDSGSSGSDSSDSGDDSEDWDMSESSSDEEIEDSLAITKEQRMRRWLKDSDESDFEDAVKKPQAVSDGWEVKRAAKQEKRAAAAKAAHRPDESSSDEAAPAPAVVEQEKLSEKDIVERTREILSGKSRKDSATGVSELARLDELLAYAKAEFGINLQLSIAVSAVSFIFDSSSGLFKLVTDQLWMQAIGRIKDVIELMRSAPSVTPVSIHEFQPAADGAVEEVEDAEKLKRMRHNGNAVVSALAELVDDEFTKSFQAIEQSEYSQKLANLPTLIEFIMFVRSYMITESSSCGSNLVSRLSLRMLWHLHYQSEKSIDLLSARIPDLKSLSPDSLMAAVFAHGTKREKASAILLRAFIAASHHDIITAKRLIASDLFDLVTVSDVSLQIQYNRAIAMVGVAAFANGDVHDAYNLLTDLCTSSRLRELLAQGVSRAATMQGNQPRDEKAIEQEKSEKRRLLPYHIHMNIELIESAYSLSAMVLEISHLSQNLLISGSTGGSKRLAKYKRHMDAYERQVYSGPPESAKDAIVVAGRALLNDDVEKAVGLVSGMRIWDMLPSTAKSTTIDLIRVAALETYILNNFHSHKSFDMNRLASLVGLSVPRVRTTVCRLIMTEQIHAKIKNEFVVLEISSQTKLGRSTAALAEQVNRLESVSCSSGAAGDASTTILAEIIALLNPPTVSPQGVPISTPEIGARRVRGQRVGLAHSKALAAMQVAAEKRLNTGLAKRRGWEHARGQPLQGTVVSMERKKLFGKSYGY
jgi:translation initiation factor 3 subunit C